MELDWLLAPPLPAAVPRQRVLYLRLREAILSGRLPADTCLPASRSLAATLGIARNTVLFAYEQLVAEGCLVADRQGTRVATLPAAVRAAQPASPAREASPTLSARAAAALQREPARDAEALPFSPGVPDFGAFPSAPGAPASNAPGATPAGGSSAMRRTAAIPPCARRSPAT